MASERHLRGALDLLTTGRLEDLEEPLRTPVRRLRHLLGDPNVVGIGISEKLVAGQPAGRLALTFYVERKILPNKLKGDRLVPPALPEAISGPWVIPTDVIELGRLRPERHLTTPLTALFQMLRAQIEEFDLPAVTARPRRGMEVVQPGRGPARAGFIRDLHFRFVLAYDGVGEIGFRDQVLATRYARSSPTSPLVLDRKTGRTVGLHFAGSPAGSIFSPIDRVLQVLGERLLVQPRKPPSKAAAPPAKILRKGAGA